MLNAMTIDVEDYFHVAAFAEQIPPGQWASLEYRVEANTERLLRVFDDSRRPRHVLLPGLGGRALARHW